MSRALALALVLTGCTSRGGIVGGDPSPGEPPDDDDSAADDDDDAPPFDCATVPSSPISRRIIEGPRGYHGLAFDDDGWIYGSDGNALIRSTYGGDWEVFVPGLGQLEQILRMPDGDLAVAVTDDASIRRVTPEGGISVIATDVGAYGLVWGPDDKLWTLNNSRVTRIDTNTGQEISLGFWTPRFDPHSGDFSRDFSKLYIGAISTDGTVGVMHLDESFNRVGEPEPLAVGVGEGWHDGVAVDNCGWIYIPDFRSRTLFRLDPDGTRIPYFSWAAAPDEYGHGVVWGSGVGGWRADALYLPMPYNGNTVQEIVVGTYSRTWEGTVINAPEP